MTSDHVQIVLSRAAERRLVVMRSRLGRVRDILNEVVHVSDRGRTQAAAIGARHALRALEAVIDGREP